MMDLDEQLRQRARQEDNARQHEGMQQLQAQLQMYLDEQQRQRARQEDNAA